jgi:hypothetical protein
LRVVFEKKGTKGLCKLIPAINLAGTVWLREHLPGHRMIHHEMVLRRLYPPDLAATMADLSEEGFSLELPLKDIDRIEATPPGTDLSADPSGWVQTQMEPLYAVLLPALLRPDARPEDLQWNDLLRVRDWFSAERTDLAGLTWEDLVATATQWHEAMRTRRSHGVEYRGSVPDALVILSFSSGWTLHRLMERRDFIREGISMGHCVGGSGEIPDGDSDYYRDTKDGTNVVFSLRNPRGVPEATVELGLPIESHPGPRTGFNRIEILQVQGPDDEVLDFDAQVYLRHALYHLGLLDAPDSPKGGPLGKSLLTSDLVWERLGFDHLWVTHTTLDALHPKLSALSMTDLEARARSPNARTRLKEGLERTITQWLRILTQANPKLKAAKPEVFVQQSEEEGEGAWWWVSVSTENSTGAWFAGSLRPVVEGGLTGAVQWQAQPDLEWMAKPDSTAWFAAVPFDQAMELLLNLPIQDVEDSIGVPEVFPNVPPTVRVEMRVSPVDGLKVNTDTKFNTNTADPVLEGRVSLTAARWAMAPQKRLLSKLAGGI